MPKAAMPKDPEFVALRQHFQRAVLPDSAIAVDELGDLRVKHEKAAIDPIVLALRFFEEAGYSFFLYLQTAEAPGR